MSLKLTKATNSDYSINGLLTSYCQIIKRRTARLNFNTKENVYIKYNCYRFCCLSKHSSFQETQTDRPKITLCVVDKTGEPFVRNHLIQIKYLTSQTKAGSTGKCTTASL